MSLDSLDDMPTDDLKAIFLRVQDILERRSIIESAPIEMARLTRDVLDAEGIEPGDPWRPPTGAHDAYPQGWTVEHDGQTWESLTGANVWEPGESGWRLLSDDDTPAAWVRPSGAHDAYQPGDRVTYDGAVYESVHPGANTWSPDEYPPAWDRIDTQEA